MGIFILIIIFLGLVGVLLSLIRHPSLWNAIALVLLIGVGVLLLRPVCTPLSEEQLKAFSVPIEQRTNERDTLYLRIWQKRDGQWYQCKTYISRIAFF